MQFRRSHFDPEHGTNAIVRDDGFVLAGTGGAPGDTYIYSPTVILALNVALATNRPLLVAGEPGSGKTTLAMNAAHILKWWYYRETISSRMQATDLFYQFDALRRLNDANTPKLELKPSDHYVEPGVLWWAFDPESALVRGAQQASAAPHAANPGLPPPPTNGAVSPHAVVLLDEIDKADPDVPNDLLEAFDARRFPVREIGNVIQASTQRTVLLVLTTNGERELPPAFLRRCVTLTLPPPSAEFFTLVANSRYGADQSQRHEAIALEVMNARAAAKKSGMRMPSTAEFLDAVHACRELDVNTASEAWRAITGSVLLKTDRI